ncbi:hypothetical protein FO519_004833 [Halicephalobus sp. NKZ332]|nr:hypothetical protein FO519_004833 [Halicephalobus sp. NKZ332]
MPSALNEKISKIISIVRESIPDAPVFNFGATSIPTVKQEDDPKKYRLQSFFAAKLSPQSRDGVTFATCRRIFYTFEPFTIEKLAEATEEDFRKILIDAKHGFTKTHAQQIVASIKTMVEDFEGDLPKTREGMMTLKGVGPKVANLLMQLCWSEKHMVVDTHCVRVGQRIGLHSCKTAEKAMDYFQDNVDPDLFEDISVSLIAVGQTVCKSQNPQCTECPIRELCNFGKNRVQKKNEEVVPKKKPRREE